MLGYEFAEALFFAFVLADDDDICFGWSFFNRREFDDCLIRVLAEHGDALHGQFEFDVAGESACAELIDFGKGVKARFEQLQDGGWAEDAFAVADAFEVAAALLDDLHGFGEEDHGFARDEFEDALVGVIAQIACVGGDDFDAFDCAVGAHSFDVDFAEAIDFVAEEIEAHGGGVASCVHAFVGSVERGGSGWEDVEDAATEGEVAWFFDGIEAFVAAGLEPVGEVAEIDAVAFANDACDVVEFLGRGDALHERLDAGEDDGGACECGERPCEAKARGEEIGGDGGFARA